MKVAVAAFLFAKRNVNINHKKSPEKNQSSNLLFLNDISI